MRPFDLALAVVLAALAVVETFADGEGHSTSFNIARAACAVTTMLTLAGRRTWPGFMALGLAADMTLESLVTESPDQMAVLVAAVIASYSVAAYVRHKARRARLGSGGARDRDGDCPRPQRRPIEHPSDPRALRPLAWRLRVRLGAAQP